MVLIGVFSTMVRFITIIVRHVRIIWIKPQEIFAHCVILQLIFHIKLNYSCDEINAHKEGGSPQTLLKNALDTVGCIAEEGVHAILLVIKLDRISQAEVELAKKTLFRVFGYECREKFLLVITNCEDNLVDYPKEGEKWLAENVENTGSNFKNYFALVNENPKKVIFVNNKNLDTVSYSVVKVVYPKYSKH